MGEAVLGRKVGNKAILYGAIAGTIPDLDVIARFFTDTITATEMHRGFSHSIVFAVLMAPVLGWLVSKIEKKSRATARDWTWLFFWGLFTHPILDAFTTWGTQLFWPFDVRLAFKTIFVIDPLYTVPFLVCVVIAMFRKRGSLPRKRINKLGLILSCSYLLLTVLLKAYTYQHFITSLDNQHIQYTEIETKPSPLNTILWTANVDAGDRYLIGDYSLFDTDRISFREFPKSREQSHAWIEKPNVQRLIDIAQGWYVIEEENGKWYFNDLRFGTLPTKPKEEFVFRYLLEEKDGEVVATESRKSPEDARELLKTLWGRIWGN